MEPGNVWRTKRLIFRAPEVEDEPFLQSMHYHGSDALQNSRAALPKPQSKADAKAHRESLEKLLVGVIICLPAPEAVASDTPATVAQPIPIGSCGLSAAPAHHIMHRNTQLGINISQPYQSQGYGTEAILWMLEFAFRHAALHRVGIGAFEYNDGAVRLYQKLGFTEDGRQRQAWYYKGKFWDMVESSMLEDEWWEKYGRREKSA